MIKYGRDLLDHETLKFAISQGRIDELSDFFNADSDTVFFGETANPTLHLLLLNTGNLL